MASTPEVAHGPHTPTSTHAVRNAFLTTLSRVAPQVAADLAENCLPRFMNLAVSPEITDAITGRQRTLTWQEYASAASEEPGFQDLERAFIEWQARHHVETSWMRDQALEVLKAWERSPATAGKSWDPLQGGLLYQAPSQFTLPAQERWDVLTETRTQCRERIEAAFHDALNRYLDSTEASLRRDGVFDFLVDATSRQRVEIFARYQVNGENVPRLQREYALTRSSIYNALEWASNRLAIPRNKRAPGRRKSAKAK